MSERPTVRPVTLARLVETAHLCESERRTTEEIAAALDITHRRARETILEALRIDLIDEDDGDDPTHGTSHVGAEFLEHVRAEDWVGVSSVLSARSPHYRAFIEALDDVGPPTLQTVLDRLEELEEHSGVAPSPSGPASPVVDHG